MTDQSVEEDKLPILPVCSGLDLVWNTEVGVWGLYKNGVLISVDPDGVVRVSAGKSNKLIAFHVCTAGVHAALLYLIDVLYDTELIRVVRVERENNEQSKATELQPQ